MKLANLLEDRDPNLEYKEDSTKGIVHKATVALKGAKSGVATKLARRFVAVNKGIIKLEAAKVELHSSLSSLVLEKFNDTTDILITRVVKTSQFAVQLAKQQEAKAGADVVNYETLCSDLIKLIDASLLPKIEELTKAHTEYKAGRPAPKTSLMVKALEEATVKTAAENPLAHWLSKASDFIKGLVKSFRDWGKDYDVQLKELIKNSKQQADTTNETN